MNYRRPPTLFFLCIVLFMCRTSAAQVTFSSPGGFYPKAFTLTLTVPEGQSIRYTTDGSLPTIQSSLYQHPLQLSPELYSTRDLFMLRNTPEDNWNPPSQIRHAIVLRAQAFDSYGHPVGSTVTHTYFISDLIGHEPNLPTVSVVLDPHALFDPDSGIFSPNGWNPDDAFNSGNFNQHGREWERLAHVEYYELDNKGFSQPIGIRVHGGKTRRLMQKPLKLYARKEYGENKIRYHLFDECSYSVHKRLILRPFCAALNSAGIQDLLAQKIAQPLRFVSLASRPVTLYINGEYWGIYFLQESPDEHLVEQIYGVDDEAVNLIGAWMSLENGSDSLFREMMQWLHTADLSTPSQYEYLCSLIDLDNYIDYLLFESFIANQDWPANNTRRFQFGQSSWRWIFYDGDDCFAETERYMPYIITYQGEDSWPSWSEETLLLRKLMESSPFLERFGNRLYELSSSVFDYSNTSPILKNIKEDIRPEIEWQSERFGTAKWEQSMSGIDKFLRSRPKIFLYQMERLLALPADNESAPHVFPNPAHDYVDVEITSSRSGWTHCTLYDMMSRQVMSQPLFVSSAQRTLRIALPTLPAGVYILRFANHNSPLPLTICAP